MKMSPEEGSSAFCGFSIRGRGARSWPTPTRPHLGLRLPHAPRVHQHAHWDICYRGTQHGHILI